MLILDNKNRLKLKDIFNHPWVKKFEKDANTNANEDKHISKSEKKTNNGNKIIFNNKIKFDDGDAKNLDENKNQENILKTNKKKSEKYFLITMTLLE